MVVSLHLSGLVARGTEELSVLLASAIDATHRSGLDMLGNQYGIVSSSSKKTKSKRIRSAYSFTQAKKLTKTVDLSAALAENLVLEFNAQ